MKKILIGLVLLAVVVGGLGYAFRRSLTMAVIPRIAQQRMLGTVIDDLPDGLHVALCGAGSPLPDPVRSGPCVAVLAGDRLFVIDSGTGGSRNLGSMGFRQGDIEAILLTHFHSDHIDGLGEMLMQRWVTGSNTLPTPLHGPSGVEKIAAGFNQAYSQDAAHRTGHHGREIAPPSGAGARAVPFVLPAEGSGVKIIEDDDLTVTAFAVDHSPVSPAVGYRFDYKDRSILISGDTDKSENIVTFGKGVDLFVHEALDAKLVALLTQAATNANQPRLAKITQDILDYHATPVEVAEMARDAGAQELLFYHIVPPLLLPTMEEIFVEGVGEVYSGPVSVGKDGTFMSLPAGTKEITKKELL